MTPHSKARAVLFAFVTSLAVAAGTSAQTCLNSGTDVDLQTALNTGNTLVQLCQGAVFQLSNTIYFTVPNQVIQTIGYPHDSSRAVLRIVSPFISTAVFAGNNGGSGVLPNVQLRAVEVDGGAAQLGFCDNVNCPWGALIMFGGVNASGHIVDDVYAHDPRGWSCLAFEAGGSLANPGAICTGAQATNSQFGPAGTDCCNLWADGISLQSLQCTNSQVFYNTITDAADGGIVVFGSAGSQIHDNTVQTISIRPVVGISMTDYFAGTFNGDFSNVNVYRNVIVSNTYMKIGFAMGGRLFDYCPSNTNQGGSVYNNEISGTMGYGYIVDGVTNWSVTGNCDYARHRGIPATDCDGTQNPQADSFLVHWRPDAYGVSHSAGFMPGFDDFGSLHSAQDISDDGSVGHPARFPCQQ